MKKHASTRTLGLHNIPKLLILSDPESLTMFFLARSLFPYTQLNYAGLYQMKKTIQMVNEKNIGGSIVELGCGRGGCGALMADVSSKLSSPRSVFLLDSFEGLSEPVNEDYVGSKKKSEKIKQGYLQVSEESVLEALALVSVKARKLVRVVKGWFSDTLPSLKKDMGTIAVLRLDADLYEPTIYALRELYDSVAVGGYVVIDDYKNWIGARKALFDFFHERNISPYLQEYPYGGVAYFVKE